MSIDQLVVSTRRSPARAAIVIGLAVALIAGLTIVNISPSADED